jgi:hypothetical protein
MSEALFVTRRDEGPVKLAMEAKLSDNPDSWVEEVIQEAHKQHSFLGNHDASVVMREVDGERAYGLGHILVRTKSERLNTPAGEALAEAEGNVRVKIPVIIREGRLKSLDTFIDARGRPQPLTDRRIRAALFRPNIFDSPGNPPAESMTLAPHLLPPDRAESQVLGRGAVSADGVKLSSERSLLEAISPTITQEDRSRMELALNQDQELACQLIDKHGSLVQVIAEAKPASPIEIAQTAFNSVQPDVAVLSNMGDRYIFKQASSRFYSPVTIVGDRIKIAQLVGEPAVRAAEEMGDTTLITADPVVQDESADQSQPAEMVESYGQYKVMDNLGREHLGWIFPVTDFEGAALPLRVFTNGNSSAIQGDIAGVLQGKLPDPPSQDTLSGDGFFYRVTETGGVQAFPPGTVQATFVDAEGPATRFETIMGDSLTLRLVPGLKQPASLGEGVVGLPDSVRFCPLRGEALKLVESPDLFVKPSDIEKEGSVRIFGDGSTWTFQGPAVAELPRDQRTMISADDALLLSGALGMSEKVASAKLKRASVGGGCEVQGLRQVKTPASYYLEARGHAEKLAAALPAKELLLKEAADIDDPMAVDKVLSLGFMTPENFMTFVDYLPDLEETVYKLSHLLIAVRLGLPDVPEQSVSNAVKRLEETIVALRELAFRGQASA